MLGTWSFALLLLLPLLVGFAIFLSLVFVLETDFGIGCGLPFLQSVAAEKELLRNISLPSELYPSELTPSLDSIKEEEERDNGLTGVRGVATDGTDSIAPEIGLRRS